MAENKYISVFDLTVMIKKRIETDENLNNVFLKGEISNFKAHSSGHYYFSLKDDKARIRAIMFKGNNSKLIFMPQDGMKVLIEGRISIYEASGDYQIYVDNMLEDGIGNLYIAFEQLKEKLAKEGLFDKEHKKKIPRVPLKIGIITASTGAAIKDILSTIKRRFPLTEVIIFPSLVQGEEASKDIIKQLKKADSYNLDTIIIGRGGGSIEDMWCFNDEELARTIYNLKTPIISAVGHEIDFTISDFVADLRAPTPTAAAELAVPNKLEIISYLDQSKVRLNNSITHKFEELNLNLKNLKESNVLIYPEKLYQIKQQKLDILINNINTTISQNVYNNKGKLINILNNHLILNPVKIFNKKINSLNLLIEKTEVLNPLNELKRGYSIVIKNDKAIKNIKAIKIKDNLNVKMQDGILDVTVNNIRE